MVTVIQNGPNIITSSQGPISLRIQEYSTLPIGMIMNLKQNLIEAGASEEQIMQIINDIRFVFDTEIEKMNQELDKKRMAGNEGKKWDPLAPDWKPDHYDGGNKNDKKND